MSVYNKIGGGSNRVTLDGKPPEKRINLKNIGDVALASENTIPPNIGSMIFEENGTYYFASSYNVFKGNLKDGWTSIGSLSIGDFCKIDNVIYSWGVSRYVDNNFYAEIKKLENGVTTILSKTNQSSDKRIIILLNNTLYDFDYEYSRIFKSTDFGKNWTDITKQINKNNIEISNLRWSQRIVLNNIFYVYNDNIIYSFDGESIKKVLTLTAEQYKRDLTKNSQDLNNYNEKKIISLKRLENKKYSYRYYKVTNNSNGKLEYKLLNTIENTDELVMERFISIKENPFSITYLDSAKNELRKFPVTAYVIEDREKG